MLSDYFKIINNYFKTIISDNFIIDSFKIANYHCKIISDYFKL